MPPHRIRIGLNARWLQLPAGGAREYTLNLIRGLLEIDSENEYVVFHANSAYMGCFPSAEEVLVNSGNKLWWDYIQLPAAVSRQSIDLFWTPSYVVPFPIRCRSVASVLDLAYFIMPESYQLADVLYMRVAMPGAFRRAAALVAISEHTCRDLVRLFPFTQTKVKVTPIAPSSRFRPSNDQQQVDRVRSKYGLSFPYIFYAGSMSPRKGLPFLLQAFARAKKRFVHHRLVLTGGWKWGKVKIQDLAARFGVGDQVAILGEVPAEDMPLLYEGADLFVYPSLYEGFGLPVLEAMACGCPVVCSNLTSLPEVAGDAALMVNPRDVPSLADAICLALSDPGLRWQLKEQGSARAARFSWRKTAQQTLRVFESVAGCSRE